MQLSKNLTLEELTHTDTGLVNVPIKTAVEKLLYLANYVGQLIRDRWGRIKPTSGYRSSAVNAAAGSTSHSQHLLGEAMDFVPLDADIDEVFEWIVKESGIPFGQCIRESRGGAEWIHISLPRLDGTNQEALVYDGKSYRTYQ